MENGLPICASAVESDDMVVFSLLWIDHGAAHSNHQLKRFISFHRPRFVRFVIATLRSMVLTTYCKILRDEAENKHFREGATKSEVEVLNLRSSPFYSMLKLHF